MTQVVVVMGSGVCFPGKEEKIKGWGLKICLTQNVLKNCFFKKNWNVFNLFYISFF